MSWQQIDVGAGLARSMGRDRAAVPAAPPDDSASWRSSTAHAAADAHPAPRGRKLAGKAGVLSPLPVFPQGKAAPAPDRVRQGGGNLGGA